MKKGNYKTHIDWWPAKYLPSWIGRWINPKAYYTKKEVSRIESTAARSTLVLVKDTLKLETSCMSSTTNMIKHPLAQRLIAHDDAIVTHLLKEIEKKGGDVLWFSILWKIVGGPEIPEKDRGRTKKMGEAWIKWGKLNGYL